MSQLQKKPQSPTAKRVAAYRQRMRDAGLVQKTMWVLDTKNPAVLTELAREARIIAASEEQRSVMAWIEAMQAEVDLGPDYPLPDQK
jgi:hypothetical protein